jgi:hypothetical protein
MFAANIADLMGGILSPKQTRLVQVWIELRREDPAYFNRAEVSHGTVT